MRNYTIGITVQDNATPTIRRVESSVSRLERTLQSGGVESYSTDLANSARRMDTYGNETRQATSVQDQFNRELKETKGNAGSAGGALKGLGGMMTGLLATAGIGMLAKGMFDLAKENEKVGVSFEVLLKSSDKAKQVLGELDKFSAVTPFEPEQVRQAGKSLLAFGVQSEELLPTLQKIGDISAGTGKDFNELATIYGKARIAGTLYGEDINQLVEAGIPVMGEFAKSLGTTEANVKKMASEGKLKFKDLETAFKNLTSEGGLYFDLMKKQSQTIDGRLSTLVGNLKALGGQMGGSFMPFIGTLIDVGNEVLLQFDRIAAAFAFVENALSPLSDVFYKVFGEDLGSAASIASRIVDGITGFFNSLSTPLYYVAQAFAPIFEAILNLRNYFSQFTAEFEYLLDGVQPFFEGLYKLFDFLFNRLKLGEFIMEGFMEVFSTLSDLIIWASNAFEWLVDALITVYDWFEKAGQVIDNTSKAFERMGNQIEEWVTKKINEAIEGIKSLLQWAGLMDEEVNNAAGSGEGGGMGILGGMLGSAGGALDEAKGLFSQMADEAKKGPLGEFFGGMFGKTAGPASASDLLGTKAAANTAAAAAAASTTAASKGIDSITGGGAKQTHITINIGKQVETVVINSGSVGEGAKSMGDAILEELTRVLNQAQTLQNF